MTVKDDTLQSVSPLKRYEGWIRLVLMVAPMVAGYFDLKYTARDAIVKIDRIEKESDRRTETINQLAIDVAVLKSWVRTQRGARTDP
jgi:hypothetical protein